MRDDESVWLSTRFLDDDNVGQFRSSAIAHQFVLTGITTGRQPTVKLQKMPEVYDVEPWDGEDGTPIEEPSLEDIMGDEL